MFNYDSPIINNTMGNEMPLNHLGYPVAPNPIGNIMNIGSMGYNNNMGGYYNGNYNNFYNPYMVAKQQELAQARMAEEQRKQSDVLKMISRKANKSLGVEIDESDLNRLYDPPQENPYVEKEEKYMRLVNLHYNATQGNPLYARQVEYNNMMYDKAKEYMPDDTSLFEFTEKISPVLENIVMTEYKSKQKANISKLYNADEYKQLINMHSNANNYFASMYDNNAPSNGEISIDDMKVELPNHLAQTYAQKKAEFMQKIFNRG